MAARPISARGYRRLAFLALAGLPLIIVVGGVVRLTGSGLGCPEWPNCESNRLVAPAEYHAVVEFVNRLLSGLVGLPIVLAVWGAVRRRPRRRDLLVLSSLLLAGVVVQVLVGRLTVVSDLSPLVVMTHFLLAMVMLAAGVLLYSASRQPDDGRARELVGPDLRRLGNLIVGTTALVILLGSVVTAAGPHGGDEYAVRLDVPLRAAAQFHGLAVVLLLSMVTAMILLLKRSDAPTPIRRGASVLMGVLLAQAAVGYAQYFSGVPAILVGLHIGGAVAVWMTVLSFRLGLVDHGRLESPPAAEEPLLVPA